MACTTLLFALAIAAQGPAPVQKSHVLDRVALIGASVSHAYMGHVLKKALRHPGAELSFHTAFLFSLTPEVSGRHQVRSALAKRPTLLVGVDFLFWYAYILAPRKGGQAKELERRMKRVEKGLATLAQHTGALVIGDIPDMTGADPRLIAARKVPTPEVLAKLNDRVRAWASERSKAGRPTLVVPLSSWAEQLRKGKLAFPASADGKHPRTPVSTRLGMHADGIHPSPIGAVLLGNLVCDEIRAQFGKQVREGFVFDAWAVLDEYELTPKLLAARR